MTTPRAEAIGAMANARHLGDCEGECVHTVVDFDAYLFEAKAHLEVLQDAGAIVLWPGESDPGSYAFFWDGKSGLVVSSKDGSTTGYVPLELP